MRIPITSLAMVLVVAACGDPPTSTPTSALQDADVASVKPSSPKLVPYRVDLKTGQGSIVPGGRCGAGLPIVTALGEGAGTGTHLGNLVVEASHCQDVANPAAGFWDGLITITGADGSEVHAVYDGYFVPTDVPGIVGLVGEFQVTGGTGRFVGATGSGDIDGTLNQATLETLWVAEGTISSVGSLH